MSCTISSPLTIVSLTVSPVLAHSVGLRMTGDVAADAAIAEHGRNQRVLAVRSGVALCGQVATGGEEERTHAEPRAA